MHPRSSYNYAYEGMFTYNLWMGCLHPDTSRQLLCPVINIAMSNNFKHSHVHFIQFFSNKARFSHASTVTIYITFLLWKVYNKKYTKYTAKSTSVS